jgi:hypothetical protein
MVDRQPVNKIPLIAAIVGLAAMALAPRRDLRTGRAVFWSGGLLTCISSYFIAETPGVGARFGASAFVLAAVIFVAYVHTPFLNIRGRRISFYSQSSELYGGGVTVAKSWWRLVGTSAVLTIGAVSLTLSNATMWPAVVAALIVIAIGAVFGYRDSGSGGGFSGGQTLQFALVSVLTLGVFPLSYLAGYYGSRIWLFDQRSYGRHQRD